MMIINTFSTSTMKYISRHQHLNLGFLLLSVFLLNTPIFAEQELDRIAAVVNSDVVMLSEVKAATRNISAKQRGGLSQRKIYREVLEKLIMDKIQVQKAKALGIKIDDAAVDAAMLTIAEQNKLNLQQLRVALIKQGLNYKEFRESLRDRLYTNNLRKRQQGRNNEISEDEIDDLIQAESFNLNQEVQYNLIDIVIPNNTESVKDFNLNLKRAQNLRTRLLRNKNLSAAEMTKLGVKKKNLGWQNAAALSPIYMRTLSLMGEGELSTIIRDTKGFHILKLVEQRGGKSQQTTEARVRHILIKADEPQAKLKITQLRNKILAGGNFSQLARKYSADKGSAANGGELAMTNVANYVPEFAELAKSLPTNTLSQPIQTKFGWHILEVLDRRTSDKTRENIKKQAKQLVGKKKQDEKLDHWLKTLRDEAFVEYRVQL